ncbi:MAG: hypothetical protein JWN20_2791, partial [Jatrophihabitantaceae bacterium]|nr:hypothetical protein [Jatrophihabitantaceae bacterium]
VLGRTMMGHLKDPAVIDARLVRAAGLPQAQRAGMQIDRRLIIKDLARSPMS